MALDGRYELHDVLGEGAFGRVYRGPLFDAAFLQSLRLLLAPLCLAVAIVYKAIRLENLSELPRQALAVTVWIIGGMAVAGAVLVGVIKIR